MRKATHAPLVLFTAAAGLLLVLSGCAGPSQSKAAACTDALKAVDSVTSSFNGGIADFTTDPTGSAAVLERAASQFTKDLVSVTNPDIVKVTDPANAAVKKFAKDVRAAAADSSSADLTKLGTSSQAVSAAFIDVRKACE